MKDTIVAFFIVDYLLNFQNNIQTGIQNLLFTNLAGYRFSRSNYISELILSKYFCSKINAHKAIKYNYTFVIGTPIRFVNPVFDFNQTALLGSRKSISFFAII